MMRQSTDNRAPVLVPSALAQKLLAFYNYPDPRRRGRTIRGYDRPHALRTARMCATVARRLGHPDARLYSYQIACLLHDLGRAGLDQKLFGTIWSWARRQGIPSRPREWRAGAPPTPPRPGNATSLPRYPARLPQLPNTH